MAKNFTNSFEPKLKSLEELRDAFISFTSATKVDLRKHEDRLKYLTGILKDFENQWEKELELKSHGLDFANQTIFRNSFCRPEHPNLIELTYWIIKKYGLQTVTSAARSRKIHRGDSGVHMTNPLRAKDLRSRDYKEPERIAMDINANWIYDFKRPHFKVCIYHTINNDPKRWHFHLQVHDRTEMKK